ncbi:MAG: HipA domain-containing protein, partial [Clostridia bacterium]|nr:HipA domain-containing protein [Clostridia bacterium]
MKDYSEYPIDQNVFYSGAERKEQITINGNRYIMKFQKNSEIGMVFNHISEYIGSHMFELLEIPVQETLLGVYNGENIVLLKNFVGEGEVLTHFNDVGESSLEEDKEMYQYSYDDIQKMLQDNKKLTNVEETVSRFWDMFVIDALNGNFDRHGGNWGFLKKDNQYRIAPVYDNGSSMYPKLNTSERINEVLESQEEIEKRVYQFPTSHVKLNGKKSSYYEVINSLQFEECNKAILRIVPRIDFGKIEKLIDGIEGIDKLRKTFYKTMYRKRYELILKPAYEKLAE